MAAAAAVPEVLKLRPFSLGSLEKALLQPRAPPHPPRRALRPPPTPKNIGLALRNYKGAPPRDLSKVIPTPHRLRIYPQIKSSRAACKEPLKTFDASQIAILDPTGARTRLFSKTNPDAIRVGDVALARFSSGEPFGGVVMNIRRQGPDSALLLRGRSTKVGTELWVKYYSPTVKAVELVERSPRKMRRARAYYFRKPKHDRGDLSNILDSYERTRRQTRKTEAEKQARAAAAKKRRGVV